MNANDSTHELTHENAPERMSVVRWSLRWPSQGSLPSAALRPPTSQPLSFKFPLPPSILVILALAAFYGLMFQKYRAYDIDNPWFLSFAYNLFSGGGDTDVFLGMPFPRGMDGTVYFGKLAAYTLSAPLGLTGWLPRAASLVVISFVSASLMLWRSTLASWGFPEKLIASYLLLLGLTEPVLTTAEKFRYEFFAFFLFSLAVWLASRRRGVDCHFLGHAQVPCLAPCLALWVAFLAVETEPAALACPVAVWVLLSHDGASWKRLALLTACAAALAFGVYALLHPRALPGLIAASHPAAGFWPGKLLSDYFVKRPRHLADLVFLLGGYALLARSGGGDRLQAMLVRAALALMGVLMLTPHTNVAYMIFPMPFLVLLALRGYGRTRGLRWVPVAFASLLLAQYGALYAINYHEGFSHANFNQARAAIAQAEQQLHLDDAQVRIVGDYSVWFAHPRHFSAGLERAVGDLYLCFAARLQQDGLAWPSVECARLRERVAVREVSRVNLLGHELHILTPIESGPMDSGPLLTSGPAPQHP